MTTRSSIKLQGLVLLGRRRPLLTSVFAVAIVLTVIFAVKAIVHFTYWNEHRTRPVASWMSPNYIARVWKLNPDDLQETLGTRQRAENNKPIARIAVEMGKSPAVLVEQFEALIEDRYGEPPS